MLFVQQVGTRFAAVIVGGALFFGFLGSAGAVAFRFPVISADGIVVDGFPGVIHCDHDPEDKGMGDIFCLAYDGRENFPFCYDQHDGTDFVLDGGFDKMDAGSLEIVAAADGEVISVHDGEYDRCHADIATKEVTCDGHPIVGNHVKIRHSDNYESWYWHIKTDSIVVNVGDQVTCGQVLGLIGSSGVSSMPHIHFEVHTPEGNWIDPYAGEFSQAQSLWVMQEDPATGLPGTYCEGELVPVGDVGPEQTEDMGSVGDNDVFEGAEENNSKDVVKGDIFEGVDTLDSVSGDVDSGVDDDATVADDPLGQDSEELADVATGDTWWQQNDAGGCGLGRQTSAMGTALLMLGLILSLHVRRRQW